MSRDALMSLCRRAAVSGASLAPRSEPIMTAACLLERPTATRRFPSSRSQGRSKLSPMTETRTSLLRRVRNPADSASWAEFVGLYEPLLMAYVRQRGLDEHDARDVVQSIFITLLRKMPGFELDKSRGRF